MPKENKYIKQINTANEALYNTILALGEETKKQMDEAKLLYSEAGSTVKINEIFKAAMEKANELKDEHVKNLNYKLQVERGLVEQNKENYSNKSTEEKILYELQKLNGFNEFSTQLTSMETEQILGISNNEYLSEQKASLIRRELSERAKNENSSELAVQAKLIKSTTVNDLLDEAQSVINTYSNGQVFPGIPISIQMQGGINKILHEDMVAKTNEDFYFKGGYIE